MPKTRVPPGLIYVSDSEPGIRRRRRGKHFQYFTPRNRLLRSAVQLRRIASLAIPPAYEGGVQHEIVVNDRRLTRLVKRIQELPGQQLFQYLDDEGRRCTVGSSDVNGYLREAMGGEFTAKDFRTWGATLKAVVLLANAPLPDPSSERAFRIATARVVRRVAADLNNTPAVCRKSYINPAVFDAWRSGRLHRSLGGAASNLRSGRGERKIRAFLRRLP